MGWRERTDKLELKSSHGLNVMSPETLGLYFQIQTEYPIITAMNVEQLAVFKIGDMVARCALLEPHIDYDDKIPLTDGHIDLYSSEKTHSNATLKGRVNVQVKGRKLKPGEKTPKKFSIPRVDLEGYLSMRGILFFAVFINPKSEVRKPFYCLLNPFKIQSLLDKMDTDQKSVGVALRSFPKDTAKIEAILALALQTQGESPAFKIDRSTLADISALTLYTDGTVNLDVPVTLNLSETDFSVFIETKGGSVAALDGQFTITPQSYVGTTTDLVVSCGEFTFRNPTRRQIDSETTELELSPGLRIRVPMDREADGGSISITTRPILEDRFNDLGFMLECKDRGAFLINGHGTKVMLHPSDSEAELREHFEYLAKLREVLVAVGADPTLIDLDDLDPRRGKQLFHLRRALLDKEELTHQVDHPGRLLQPVGEWNLELLVLKGETPGLWKYLDIFDPAIRQQFVMRTEDELQGERAFRVTPYDLVDVDRLPTILNLKLENIVDAYDEISEYPDTGWLANHFVLRLIQASDACEQRRGEFLDAAMQLNDWLIEKESELPQHLINRCQIVCRTGSLNQEDRARVRNLRRSVIQQPEESSQFLEISCSILLSDFQEAAHLEEQLSDKERETFAGWPIFTLWTILDEQRQ